MKFPAEGTTALVEEAPPSCWIISRRSFFTIGYTGAMTTGGVGDLGGND